MSTRHSPDIEKIKAALTGAEGRRPDKQRTARAGRKTRLRIPDSGATAKILQPLLGDPAAVQKFDDLMAKNDAKLAATLKKSKSDAVKRSAAGQKVLNAQVAERLKGLKALESKPLITGAAQQDYWLNEPILILPVCMGEPYAGVDVQASEIAPQNSFAKFQMISGPGLPIVPDVEALQFIYSWQNPSEDTYAVINITGWATYNGYAYISVPGGFWPGNRFADVSVQSGLGIYEWWNQPATNPPPQVGQGGGIFAQLDVDNSGYGAHGKVESLNITRGFAWQYTQEVVPPLGVVLVALTTLVVVETGQNESDFQGYGSIDFASGDFQVGSPAVLVSVLS
jgi:hypothetical protein